VTLQSQLFNGDAKLQAAAVSDPAQSRRARLVSTSREFSWLSTSWIVANLSPDGIYWFEDRGGGVAYKQPPPA